MQSQAFQTLGIEPTIDGRAIRDAFVRIARIYHPDRFAGQPDDVRLEAERRMKEASAAYELLKVSNSANLQPLFFASPSVASNRCRPNPLRRMFYERKVHELLKLKANWVC